MAKRLVAIFGIVSGVVIGPLQYPGSAWAQIVEPPRMGPRAAGFYVTPSFSVSETYDDNIFFSSSQQQDDFISRFTPGVKAGYQSEPFTLLGSYSFRSAIYADHPSLDAALESQLGSLELRYRPTEVLTLGFDGAYSRTEIASELNQPNPALPFIPVQATAGVQVTRVRTTFYSLMPSIAYRFNPLTRGSASYDYVVFEGGGISTTAQDVVLGLDRDITPRDTALLKSYYRHFETETSGSSASSTLSSSQESYAVTLGWKHRFTERWDVTAQAGPRISEGTGIAGETVGVEANAAVNWRFQRGTATLGYSRTELTAAGVGGGLRSESIFASVAVELVRLLHLSLTPRWVQDTPEGGGAQTTGTITIYSVDATATYQLTRWLSARLSYQYSDQVGRVDIPHNLVTIGLDFGYPTRVY